MTYNVLREKIQRECKKLPTIDVSDIRYVIGSFSGPGTCVNSLVKGGMTVGKGSVVSRASVAEQGTLIVGDNTIVDSITVPPYSIVKIGDDCRVCGLYAAPGQDLIVGHCSTLIKVGIDMGHTKGRVCITLGKGACILYSYVSVGSSLNIGSDFHMYNMSLCIGCSCDRRSGICSDVIGDRAVLCSSTAMELPERQSSVSFVTKENLLIGDDFTYMAECGILAQSLRVGKGVIIKGRNEGSRGVHFNKLCISDGAVLNIESVDSIRSRRLDITLGENAYMKFIQVPYTRRMLVNVPKNGVAIVDA